MTPATMITQGTAYVCSADGTLSITVTTLNRADLRFFATLLSALAEDDQRIADLRAGRAAVHFGPDGTAQIAPHFSPN